MEKMNDKVPLSDELLECIWGGSKIPYIIQPGDTLGDLTKKFHCSIEEACRWNNIEDPNKIFAGEKLIFKF